jgi:hypothetical protein
MACSSRIGHGSALGFLATDDVFQGPSEFGLHLRPNKHIPNPIRPIKGFGTIRDGAPGHLPDINFFMRVPVQRTGNAAIVRVDSARAQGQGRSRDSGRGQIRPR